METNQHLFLGGGCFIFSTSQAQDLSIKRDNVRILDDFRLMSRLLTFKSSMKIRAKWANHTLISLRKYHNDPSVRLSKSFEPDMKKSKIIRRFFPQFLNQDHFLKVKTKKSCDYFAFNHLYQRLGFPGHLEKVLLPERPCAQCRDCPETGSTSATGVGWWLMIFLCPLQCQKWHKRNLKKKKKSFLWRKPHIMIFIFKSVSAWNFVLKTYIQKIDRNCFRTPFSFKNSSTLYFMPMHPQIMPLAFGFKVVWNSPAYQCTYTLRSKLICFPSWIL